MVECIRGGDIPPPRFLKSLEVCETLVRGRKTRLNENKLGKYKRGIRSRVDDLKAMSIKLQHLGLKSTLPAPPSLAFCVSPLPSRVLRTRLTPPPPVYRVQSPECLYALPVTAPPSPRAAAVVGTAPTAPQLSMSPSALPQPASRGSKSSGRARKDNN